MKKMAKRREREFKAQKNGGTQTADLSSSSSEEHAKSIDEHDNDSDFSADHEN